MPLDEVKLIAPPAQGYAQRHKPTPLEERFVASVEEASGGQLRYDPCLGRAATEYARHLAQHPGLQEAPPRQLQEAALHHVGCPDGWASSHLLLSGQDGQEEFTTFLRDVAARGGIMTHIGLGRARAQAPYRWAWVVLLAERHVDLDPVPRALSPGQTLVIKGRMIEPLAQPRVLLLAPGGAVEELDMLTQPGGLFQASALLGRQRGEHWIEVLGTGPMGPRVAALFPVYVGQPPPARVELPAPPDESQIKTTEQAEQLMLDLVNQERARFGLPALQWDERLAQIARAHSQDMLAHDFFAHHSPGTGTLADRFAVARYPGHHFAENLSRSASVHEGVAGLMQSLGHRENILHPRFTHLGIGAVFVQERFGGRSLIITQNFAVPQRQISGSGFRQEVMARLDQARRLKGEPALEQPGALQQVAARFVARVQADKPTGLEEISKQIRQALDAQGVRYRSLLVQAQVVGDPQDVTVPQAATRAHVQAAALGARPVAQPSGGVLWVTLLLMLER